MPNVAVPAMEMICKANCTKGVISSIYRHFLNEHIHKLSMPIMNKWVSDIGHITEEQWDYIPGLTPRLSLCETRCFSQLLIHRAYKSPSLLLKIGARSDLNCPKCGKDVTMGMRSTGAVLEGRSGSHPHCT